MCAIETESKGRNVPYAIQWEGKKPTEAEMKEIYELRDLLDNRKTFNERRDLKYIENLLGKLRILFRGLK